MKIFYLLLFVACLPLVFIHAQTANTQLPDVNANNEVLAAIRQGDFLYIGGSFTQVGGTTRNGLARINMTTNTLDNSWNPDVYNGTFGSSGTVKGMAFSPDGTILYVGGFFDKIGGATGTDRVCLAAINVATATATAWNVQTADIFNDVKSVLVNSATGDVYVQGGFTSIYEPSTMTTFTRKGLACITAASLVTAFDPQCSNQAFREFAIASDNSKIYVGFGNNGADFTDGMGGTIHRDQFAELNATDGVPTSFNPNPDGGVFAIIQTGTSLYLCGGFTMIDGMSRDHIAKFNNALTSPTLDATFVNGVDGSIRGAFFDTDIYVFGDFKKAGTTCIESMAKLNGSTGELVTTWRVGTNKYTTQNSTKLRGSTTHQQLYAVGYGFDPFSFLGRTPRRFHVFNYAVTNALTEKGLATTNSATPVTFDFTGTSMVLDVDQVNDEKCLFADRYTDAPQNVSGITESNISNYRFVFRLKNLFPTTSTLRFKLNDLPSPPSSPAMIHIYYRNTPNVGTFTNAGTVTYNMINNTLSIDAMFMSTQEIVEFVFASDAVLPVELLSFKGKNTEGGNLLTWKTAQEQNTLHFDIERSTDNQKFEKIGVLKTKGTNSNYQFLDAETTNSIVYYRLKINDLDGKHDYSKVIALQSKDKTKVEIYPSVTTGEVQIIGAKFFQVFNLSGQVVIEKKGVETGTSFIYLNEQAAGIYIVKGVDTEGGVFSQKIIKQ